MQRRFSIVWGIFGLVSISSLAAELVDCPAKSNEDALVYLESNPGKCVKLEVKLAKRSETIKNLIEDAGVEAKIPLPNLGNQTLLDVVSVLERTKDVDYSNETAQQAIVQAVPKGDPARLKGLLLASNYLDIPAVLNACVSLYAEKIFNEDLGKLGIWNAADYTTYKNAFFKDVPKDIQKLLAQKADPILLATFEHDKPVLSVFFSPDGTRVLTGSGSAARLWDASTRGENGVPLAIYRGKEGLHADVLYTAFSPDGMQLLTGSIFNTMLWSARARGEQSAPLVTFEHDDFLASAAFNHDGTLLLTGSGSAAKLWDASTRDENGVALATFNHNDDLQSLLFNRDGTRVLTGSVDGIAKLWDASARGENIAPLATFRHGEAISSLAFSPDGTRVLTGSLDDTAKLWDANTQGENGVPLATLRHDNSVTSVAFSPDGTRIVTSAADKTVKLWNANARGESNAPLATFQPEWADVTFSPDGTRVLTSSKDKTARLWDANARGNNNAPLATFRHLDKVNAAVFSPDGTRVLTASHDKTARLWAFFDAQDLSNPLAEAQIIRFVQQNKFTRAKTPKHLVDELSEQTKNLLWGE